MPRPINLNAQKAEAWFQALNNQEIITTHALTARDEIAPTRTAAVRPYQCKACMFEPQGKLHWHLLASIRGERSLESIIDWSDLPRATLEFHLNYCMKTQKKDGSHTPYSTDHLRLPSPVARARVSAILDLIDHAPRAEQHTQTSTNKQGHRITITTRTWNHHEHLVCIWYGNEKHETLLDRGSLKNNATTQAIAAAVLWFAEQIQTRTLA